ncbi:sigma-70 family RNA polymerase sigma factor [Candidatus Hydrogenedentota bacterium]
MNDEALIERILAGEESLFSRIVSKYAGYVWAVCLSYIPNHSECEDVVQEVFVRCYRRLGTLRNKRAFPRWIEQLARRESLRWLRSKKGREATHSRYRDYVMKNGNTAYQDDPVREENQRVIRAKMKGLPPKYREALFLHYSEGYGIAKAGELSGISSAAMKKRLQRGRKMLKHEFERDFGPALLHDKHKNELENMVMAAIPLGNVPWLVQVGGKAEILARTGLIGGIDVMAKKMGIGVGVLVLSLGLVYSVLERSRTDISRKEPEAIHTPSEVSRLEPASVAKPETPPLHAEDTSSTMKSAQIREEQEMPVEEKQSEERYRGEQEEVAPTEQEPEDILRASVSGIVTDKETTPLSGARVQLHIASDPLGNEIAKTFETLTKPDGTYEITGIDAFGDAIPYASADGYQATPFLWLYDFRISPGMKRDNVNMELAEGGFAVAGEVVTEYYEPIADASVKLHCYGYTEKSKSLAGNSWFSPLTFVRTDADGHFKMTIGKEGFCDFTVTKHGYGPGYFPAVSTGTDNAVFMLRQPGAITGKVTWLDGHMAEGVLVEALGKTVPSAYEIFEWKPAFIRVDG